MSRKHYIHTEIVKEGITAYNQGGIRIVRLLEQGYSPVYELQYEAWNLAWKGTQSFQLEFLEALFDVETEGGN